MRLINSNHESKLFRTLNLTADGAEFEHADQYENEFGFVPHNYACHNNDFRVCNSVVSHDNTQKGSSVNPSRCTCHKGHCSWSPRRQDCSRGYEWVKLPIDRNHPDFDNVVDIGNEIKSAIGVKAFTKNPKAERLKKNDDVRILVAPVKLTDSTYASSDAEQGQNYL